MKNIIFVILLSLGIMISGFGGSDSHGQSTEVGTPEERANQVVFALKNKDFQALSTYVHPTKGIRFSPYSYVDIQSDKVFTKEQVKGLMNDTHVYNWGTFDGTGEPIEMTFPSYGERFVYDQDYTDADQVVVNQRLGQGNSIDNSQEIYPNATIVEYHFSGFDPQYAGMDWKSLRIVVEQEDGKWYLVGIIHDQWTI